MIEKAIGETVEKTDTIPEHTTFHIGEDPAKGWFVAVQGETVDRFLPALGAMLDATKQAFVNSGAKYEADLPEDHESKHYTEALVEDLAAIRRLTIHKYGEGETRNLDNAVLFHIEELRVLTHLLLYLSGRKAANDQTVEDHVEPGGEIG